MGADFKQFVDAVKDRVDIVQVIGERIEFSRGNKALCPFHKEKTPSFTVNSKDQYFYCFGCGAGGDVIKFLQLYENLNFKEALGGLVRQAELTAPVVRR